MSAEPAARICDIPLPPKRVAVEPRKTSGRQSAYPRSGTRGRPLRDAVSPAPALPCPGRHPNTGRPAGHAGALSPRPHPRPVRQAPLPEPHSRRRTSAPRPEPAPRHRALNPHGGTAPSAAPLAPNISPRSRPPPRPLRSGHPVLPVARPPGRWSRTAAFATRLLPQHSPMAAFPNAKPESNGGTPSHSAALQALVCLSASRGGPDAENPDIADRGAQP